LVYQPERKEAMKISFGIIIGFTIVMFCIIPYSYWDADKMIFSAIVCNILIAIVSTICLIGFNKGNARSIATTILLSLSAYSQIFAGIILYKHGIAYGLELVFLQLLYSYMAVRIAPNYKSMVVIQCNLIASTIWTNRISGFMYYAYISSDFETIGVSSLITALGAIIASVVSILSISIYKSTNNEINR
jgi:membrane protein